MIYIKDEFKKKNNEELQQNHGRIDKILDDEMKQIGYIVRSEMSRTDECINVVFGISFCIDYAFNSNLAFGPKMFNQSDMKHFAIRHALNNLNLNPKKKPLVKVAQKSLESDDALFKHQVDMIVRSYLEELSAKVNDLNADFKGKKNFDKVCPVIKSYEKLAEYMTYCVLNVVKYYKNSRLCLFFV